MSYLSWNRFSFLGGSGLMPSTAASPMSGRTLVSSHAWVVQPGVSAFG